MKIALILVTILLICGIMIFHKQNNVNQFSAFKQEWNKKYTSMDVEGFRRSIFYENLAKIEEHNASPDISYEEGVNQFTDLTEEEFIQIYLGELDSDSTSLNEFDGTGLPNEDIDWTTKDAVSKVKDQGSCGSCWAFGAVGALESLNKIYGTKTMTLYSEQMLVDCAKDGCSGCDGGLRDKAFQFVIKNGLKTGEEYPYVAKQQTCKFPTGEFKINNYGSVKAGSCDDLITALNKQPISVGVDASRWSAYKGGIFNNCQTSINHGVLLVAISQQDGYWKIKNSWGARWGENGFIRLKHPGSTCAVCNRAYYPLF